MRNSVVLAFVVVASAISAQEPDVTQQRLNAGAQALKKALDAVMVLSEEQEAASGVARAKFIPQCEAATGKRTYCTCVYDGLPVAYTWYQDEPWLLFVMSIHRRLYLGDERVAGFQSGELTDQVRFDLYMSARDAVQKCASADG